MNQPASMESASALDATQPSPDKTMADAPAPSTHQAQSDRAQSDKAQSDVTRPSPSSAMSDAGAMSDADAGPASQAPAPSPAVIIATALAGRLTAAAQQILDPGHIPAAHLPPAVRTSALLPRLIDAVKPADQSAERWLLLTAALARFPSTAEYLDFTRSVALDPASRVETDLLAAAINARGTLHANTMRVVTDAAVVETMSSSCSDHHTGIQRVVRETVPRWAGLGPVLAVTWAADGQGMRTLNAHEHHRVFAHGSGKFTDMEALAAYVPLLVAPWRSCLIFPDTPVGDERTADVLRCLARFSGNSVGHIGHDLIPMISADLRPRGEANTTAAFYSIIKHSHKVSAISHSSAAEFGGMCSGLPTQGLRGPEVKVVLEPTVGSALPPRSASASDTPPAGKRLTVLMTGTLEPHKNQRALLQAAEILWREGLDFELRQVGGRGWNDDVFRAATKPLLKAKRPLTLLGRVSEQVLWDEHRAADVVVFASLHEGYGLPVVEALSVGTPVITTNYGSQAEIAADGGCLTVYPRDDNSLADALRRFLTDPQLRQSLRDQAAGRPVRTWDDYARDTWDFLGLPGSGLPGSGQTDRASQPLDQPHKDTVEPGQEAA